MKFVILILVLVVGGLAFFITSIFNPFQEEMAAIGNNSVYAANTTGWSGMMGFWPWACLLLVSAVIGYAAYAAIKNK